MDYAVPRTLEQRYYDLMSELVSRAEADFLVYLSNKELAALFSVKEASVKRWLAELKRRGWISTTNNKHFRPNYGWCNERAIRLENIGLVQYREIECNIKK